MTTRRRYLTLEEATNILEELMSDDEGDGIVEKLVIEPPSAQNIDTDEDSGEEDGSGRPDNLPKSQLTQPCEIIMRTTGTTTESPEDEDGAEIFEDALRDVMNSSYKNLDIDLLRSNVTTPTLDSTASNMQLEKTPTRISRGKASSRPAQGALSAGSKTISRKKRLTKRQKKTRKANKKTKPRSEPDVEWVDDDFISHPNIFPEPNYVDCSNISPHEQFEKFFDDELINMLCKESNSYAVYCGMVNPNIVAEEMRVFVGILIVTGYSHVPNRRGYWSNETDFLNIMISDAMRRNRFDIIFRSIHFIDNGQQQINDKIWKLRPYTDALKQRFLNHFHPERCLSYDESMVEYYGRHGCKQFIRGKPLRFGYKMWSLNTPLGYLINFEMYQGSNPRMKEEYAFKYGKNVTPLFCMLDEFDESIKNLEFCFYFDNLFTSHSALVGLRQRGYHGTGTIRPNIIPKSCPLQSKEELKKLDRGYMESAKMESTGIKITKWVDNAVVSVASTIHGKLPITTVGRYSRFEKKRIMIPLPHSIQQYNKHMGGTDRMDQNVNAYRIGARGRKWWHPIFTWLIDVSIQNAWILHRKGGEHMSLLDFRRAIAAHYCRTYGVPKPPQTYRRVATYDSQYSSRFDGIGHFVVETEGKKRRRCAGLNCTAHPITMCKKCNVGLCIKCFEKYHYFRSN